jgi:ankyrin repeat protein
MGLFCVNMHFRTADDKTLSAALNRRGVTRNLVLPAKDGWTSMYEEVASHQDDGRIRELAGGLSKDMHVAAIAFMVHDSDIACYWLFDDGSLIDQYNSCPDYFDDDATDDESTGHSGGTPDVLLRYCRPGVRKEDLEAVLSEQTVFAENVIQGLANALGIDGERALSDYRDVAGDDRLDGADEDDDDGDGGPKLLPSSKGLPAGFAQMLGALQQGDTVDPQVQTLVEAAARGDTGEIDRLVAAGVPIDSEAPIPFTGFQSLSGLGQLLPSGPPKIAMTPLIAAIVHKHRLAAERLLAVGADPNHLHPLFGTPIHVAVGAGEVELLQLLIDRRGNISARNPQGQTPLQALAAAREASKQLDKLQGLMKSLGGKVPGLAEQMSRVKLPMDGWDACERLLKSSGAR